MSRRGRPRPSAPPLVHALSAHVSLAAAVLLIAAISAGCAGVKTSTSTDGGGGTQATGRGGTTGSGGVGPGTGAGGSGNPDAGGTRLDAGACTQVSCEQATGRYCGVIGDGCNRTIDCGACPGTQVCEEGVCVGGSDCVALTCQSATAGVAPYCGKIGNGCGRAMECGACGNTNQVCNSGICAQANCVPLTCAIAGSNGRYCGKIGDGCGGTLECGECPGGGSCGGGGVPNVCSGGTGCTPVTCTAMGGGRYCGRIGNGCGGVLECGACPSAAACPESGTSAHVCPGGTVTVPPTCTGATKTTISGTVFDPAGKNPLYNVIVYVPSLPLDPIPEGVTCDRCSAQVSGKPIAATLTDTRGHFSLQIEPVPITTNVPVVMQVGKWRRQITVPTITTCTDNPITNVDLTRLPRTRTEGNIPRIAVTTGGADALECLVRRIGLADTEFTNDAGAGRVHLYAGGKGTNSFSAGGAFSPVTTLWSSRTKLATYDIVLMSCEGSTSEFVAMKPQTSVDNVANYTNSGGRIFLSHLHFYWLQHDTLFNSTASYIGNITPPGATSASAVDLTINQSFPKGMAFAQWLAGPVVAASTTPGILPVAGVEHSVTAVIPPTTEWVYLEHNPRDSQMRRSEQYLSFNTPVGTPEAMQCGKAVFTDIHIQQSLNGAGGDDSDVAKPFPSGCKTNAMTPQAKALEFLFFDLSSCVQPDTMEPQPPVVPPPGIPNSPPPSVTTPPPVPPPPPPPPPPVIP